MLQHFLISLVAHIKYLDPTQVTNMKCKAALLLVILSSCNPLVKEGIEDAVIAVEAIEQHREQESLVKP